MRRYLAYVGLILLLGPIESTLPRMPLLHGVHVLLLLPLVFYLALEATTAEGLLLSYLAGFVEDATVSYTTGLAAFSFVAIFVFGRLALVAVRADGPVFEAFFSCLVTTCFFALTFGLRRIFESDVSPLPPGWWSAYLPAIAATGVVTPLVTAIARRIDSLQAKSPGAL